MQQRSISIHSPHRRATSLGKPARAGFTLMEVLLATLLTTLLMLSVYSGIDIYLAARRAGRAQMARDQVARAVMEMMAGDIRSVAFRLPEDPLTSGDSSEDDSTDSSDGDDTGTGSSTSAGDDMDSSVDMVEEEVVPELTLFGDATSLILRINKPLRDMNYTTFEEGYVPGARLGDMVEVQYFLADPDAGDFAAAVAAEASQSAFGSGAGEGLARTEVDVAISDIGDQDALLESTQLLAPEINSLQFSYLDGTDVYDYWDSQEFGALPTAIEIIIGFRSEQEATVMQSLTGQDKISIKSYRLVVPLPLAQPYVPEEEL